MRGRRPKPTMVKLMEGNPGRRPLNPAEPKPAPQVPEAPVELSPAGRAEWDRLAGELAALGMMTNLDRAALAAYCEAYALWSEAITAIRQYGTMVKSPSGYPMQSPYVAIANKQAELMMRIASEFGFTPASRSRIAVPDERPKQPDLLDGLFKSDD